MRKLLPVGLIASLSLVVAACGGDDDETSACHDYGTFEGATPATTFKGDVLPIFQTSCTIGSSCHGERNPSGKTYLGPPIGTEATDDDLAEIQTENINASSTRDSGLARIVPSKPAESFLMHKIDGDFDCDALKCSGVEGCGDRMPQGNAAGLPAADADVIRRWIAQGAKIP